MKKSLLHLHPVFCILSITVIISCRGKSPAPSKDAISEINLKRGEVIYCGSPDKNFGLATFENSCSENVKKDFDLAITLLHSFEYDEAEKVFAAVIDKEPGCAMAYWGVAMCNYHPLWTPPSEPELKKGAKAIEIANSIGEKTQREAGYIDAIAAYYSDWEETDHLTRSLNFEKAMEKLYTENPGDKEAAIFYALSLNGAADPKDKTFMKQKKAGSILNGLYPGKPNHPGITHYIIHTYDYPELASAGLAAARKYAAIAPYSSHALHMPSHIFTRLGLWDESIHSNLASCNSARCYAVEAGIEGHWDEELHALDYLMYSYLQKGENDSAIKQWNHLKTITQVTPSNFKVSYAFAAIPARYVLENKMWEEAAAMKIHNESFPWKKFPWQRSIFHFARLMGNVHTGNTETAKAELEELRQAYDTLTVLKDSYKANQVEIQIKAGEAWIQFKGGKNNEALELMNLAAAMEDKTGKHPVTPGEVLPARELLADMLLQMNKPAEALEAYEEDLKKHPNRFNGLYGAGVAAEKAGNREKAEHYYRQLINVVSENSTRPEMNKVKLFLKQS